MADSAPSTIDDRAESPQLADYVHTLSRANYAVPPERLTSATFPAIATEEEKEHKHFTLLDNIALLLVRKAQHDVAATGCLTLSDGRHEDGTSKAATTTFFYCKNNGCDDEDRMHAAKLHALLRTFQSTEKSRKTCVAELFALVKTACFDKMEFRFRKLQKAWEKAKVEVDDWREPTSTVAAEILSKWVIWAKVTKPTTWTKALRAILDNLLPVERVVVSPVDVTSMIALIDHFSTSEEIFNQMHRSPAVGKLRRQMKKLVRYWYACRSLADNARQNPLNQFQLKEIEPYCGSRIQYKISPATVVDIIAQKLSGYTFDSEKFCTDSHFSPTTFNAIPSPIDGIVHAECSLAIGLLQELSSLRTELPRLAIGVSKRCCVPCAAYLSFIPYHIRVAGCHGKIYPNWVFPEGGPVPLSKMTHAMKSWLIKAMKSNQSLRRPSDSSGGSSTSADSEEGESAGSLENEGMFSVE
ncbi:MAG: hypothetical protein M1825_004630 [Sarcosagium campestre]|nr:MAG: hypothetical protein M1825_004630 [Sarcosagium campestre]